jgi:16S rRNA U516 pseudouridylate synthase RsuA-like enzyme
MERLQKVIAQAGVASRRKAEEMILNRSYLVASEQEPLYYDAMISLLNQYDVILCFR